MSMKDISMCTGGVHKIPCMIRTDCHRYMAEPGRQQSYIEGGEDFVAERGCNKFWPLTKITRNKKIDTQADIE